MCHVYAMQGGTHTEAGLQMTITVQRVRQYTGLSCFDNSVHDRSCIKVIRTYLTYPLTGTPKARPDTCCTVSFSGSNFTLARH